MATGHRKLLHRHEIAQQPRFVTFSCWQRLPLLMTDAIKDHFAEHLGRVRDSFSARLLGWVVMPEHVHLVLVPPLPKTTAALLLASLKGDFARSVLRRWKELNAPILARLRGPDGRLHFWQLGGGYDRNIRDDEELLEKLQYMHDNPVTRGLVETPVDWLWSSSRWFAGLRNGALPVDSMNE